ncbi:MAG: TonB-dependent receptor [Gammaproteobacteria bacterium]|nr:MAG: TonB-dependent receptor [Gammaproteobacteria bacterium]
MRFASLLNGLSGAIVLAIFSTSLHAEEMADDSLDTVTIIGHQRDPADIPGSAHVIDQEELQTFLQGDVMRVLRAVPGVYLQEEEGFGLRPNIGIRGSGLDRSARVAILEDGILIAPAPYAAPSAYYFPTQRRIHSLEVLKGPAAVAVGPKTTGGAINLISTPIPDDFGGVADIRIGQNATADAHLNIGNRGQRFSWLLETVQSKSDGFKTIDGPAGVDMGSTGFEIQDYLVKLQLDSDPASSVYQSLRVKAGYTDQVSDETYLGLTDEDFAIDPYRRYAASHGDEFTGEHEQFQVSYLLDTESNWRAEVTAYRNNFARDWFKLRSVNGTGISSILEDTNTYATEFAYIQGATSPDDAIIKRHNNREYFSQGIQGQVSWELSFGDTELALTTGVRIHEDEEDRLQQQDGFRMQDSLLVLTSVGAPGSSTNRVSSANARSIFVDTEFRTGNWIFTPGARFEDIEMERLDFSTADPDRELGPGRVRSNNVSAFIPGVGALYRIGDNWRVFGGVNKGFNPPAAGSTASEESSINFELGARFAGDRLSFESIYFLNDYDNLVGTVTDSTGGTGEIGDQFDGGEVTVQGIELSGSYVMAELAGGRFEMPVGLQYTWTAEAEFDNAFESDFDPWGDVEVGDELPYIPEHQLRASAGMEGDSFGFNLAASYVGKMRSTAGQGEFIPAETVPSHVVWDVLARWRFTDSLSTYLKVDNLFDEVYIASRRPSGVRPGLERTAYVGLTFNL